MKPQTTRMGVDIGGTFTDIVIETPAGQYSTKVLTSYNAPEQAIIAGMHRACTQAGITAQDISQIIHGTTLATNALIERRGAKTALITTENFRDVIEMRTESRFEQYDLNLVLPEPLLPRNRRYTLPERMDAQGNVLIALQRGDIEKLAETLQQAAYESIAIGLLHSYVNDSHEKMIAAVLREKLPNVMLSLSSEVSPQMCEYERFNTTIANAYIQPLMKSYLSRLNACLANEGADCPIFLMHSGGGIISLENAADFPVRLVESGPAGGAVFAANLAAAHGLDKTLSFDMGGTTAKICLINNHSPKTARVFEVARSYRFKKGSGMPISIPVIDMVEIGTGGGSLASVNGMNQIQVGPESAGSEPGPACYGGGGTRPAVTDADLLLGKLDAQNFAGGAIVLKPKDAETALQQHIGDRLNLSTDEAAWGLAEVVDENMANAARMHAVENGEDLSQYTMIAFGGAAPLHAARLCEKLNVQRCLIPKGAGVGSAIGFLRAPFSFEANRSIFMELSAFDPAKVRALFATMETEATQFVRTCDAESTIEREYKVYMRYAGQGWEIPVQIHPDQAKNPDQATFQKLFDEHYIRLFGRTVLGMAVQIVVWSVNAFIAPQQTQTITAIENTHSVKAVGERQLLDTQKGRIFTAHTYNRDDLQAGAYLSEPCVVMETETTLIAPSAATVTTLADGCLDMRLTPTQNEAV